MTNLDDEMLKSVCGGINMRLTQFGYPNDPYSDSETRKGHGAYHSLRPDSMAITDSGLRALGLSRHDVVGGHRMVELRLRGGGVMQRNIDDRAPEREMRADLYMPRGLNRNLPDYADVRLVR